MFIVYLGDSNQVFDAAHVSTLAISERTFFSDTATSTTWVIIVILIQNHTPLDIKYHLGHLGTQVEQIEFQPTDFCVI